MAEGFVKEFNSEKGYGFLTVRAYAPGDIKVGKQDVFVHYSSIQMPGYRTLDKGEYVSFAIERGTKVPQATKVTPLGDPPATWRLTTSDTATSSARSRRILLVSLMLISLIVVIVVIGLL